MKYKQLTLPHGGKLYYVKNSINESTAVDINFDCGSRFDTIPGLAHFTEHMFFTGTDKLTKEDIAKKYFDFIEVNAGTSIRYINFNGQIFTKEFADYLKTVAMMITESSFSQENVDKEIPVVQQEIARQKDKFKTLSAWAVDYLTFGNIEFKNTTLGSQKSVASIKSEDVKNYVSKHFVANNLEVFVCSPYSLGKVKKLVIKNLESKLPVAENFEKQPYFYYNVKNTNFHKIENKDIEKCYIYINFAMERNRWDFDFKRKFGLVLDMLNDYSEGILNALRLKKSLVYGAGIQDAYYEENGIVGFSTECDKENINEIIKTLANYLKDLVKNGFTQAQLDKAKRLYEYGEATKEVRLKKLTGKLYQFKYYGKILKTKDAKKAIKSATLEEVNTLFREVFENPTVSLFVYGNATKEEVVDKKSFNELFKM
ncbi:MAG: insulinase family protein [Clostridia bacterium]|nr:insulinase family protein [Clostridia bacterium]